MAKVSFKIFLNSIYSIVRKLANSTFEQQKCKSHEKRDQLLFPKMAELPAKQKSPIDSVFSLGLFFQ